MAVDFYKSNDKHTILFSLYDDDFENLVPVFKEFKKLTGIAVDQYGTTRISHGHVQIINRILATYLSQMKSANIRLKSLFTRF